MEKIQLSFYSGDPRKRFEWVSSHQGKIVGLCDGQFCFSCDYSERKKLANFRSGRLEVALQPQLKTGPFGVQRVFYLAHLVSVPEVVEVIPRGADTGIEAEPLFNTVIYRIGGETILVDPGSMVLNGDEKEFLRLAGHHRLSAVILTHGHQDHWRFLRLLEGIDAPIYLTPFPYRLIEHTANMEDDKSLLRLLSRARVINPGDRITVGDTKVYTFPLVHSIPETMGLLLAGKRRGIHLGDFKLGEGVEKAELVTSLRAIAREEVDFLVVNVINSHLPGYALPESVVLNALTDVMIKTEGRVIVTCFSTNLERIKGLTEIAQAQGREVCFLGTGMRRAKEELSREGEVVLEREGDILDPQSLIFVSGCQAEKDSILTRVFEKFPPLQPKDSDTAVFSSRGIPGNEESIRGLIQKLSQKVRKIFLNKGEKGKLGLAEDPKIEEVFSHSTGHEQQEGMELVVKNILNPRRVLPIPQYGEGYEAFLKMIDGRELVKERVVEL